MENAIKQNIGKKYTSKDYIQTGLIAQWDGIENAGYNKHNHDITYSGKIQSAIRIQK